jgi:hypothetical protein
MDFIMLEIFLWTMEQNYALKDKLNEQILVGGFVFEYSDE